MGGVEAKFSFYSPRSRSRIAALPAGAGWGRRRRRRRRQESGRQNRIKTNGLLASRSRGGAVWVWTGDRSPSLISFVIISAGPR